MPTTENQIAEAEAAAERATALADEYFRSYRLHDWMAMNSAATSFYVAADKLRRDAALSRAGEVA